MARLVWLGILFFHLTKCFGQAPDITSISKTKGTTKTLVEIQGANFGNDGNALKVSFGAARANVISAADNLITVEAPNGATYNNITVTNTATGLTGNTRPFLLTFGGKGIDASKLSSFSVFSANTTLTEHCLCDFDNSGTVDVVTSTGDATNNALSLFTNTSTPTATFFTKSEIVTNSATLSVACEDLDGDGKKDLVAAKSGGSGDQIFVLKNTSSGSGISFAASVPYFTNSDFIKKVIIKDLDKDGKPELIASSESDNKISIFKNTSTIGNINFVFLPVVITVDGTPGTTNIISEDLNKDGYPEIVANSFLGQNIYILRNQSTASGISFSSVQSLNVSAGTNQLISADINSDNKPDVIASNFTNGSVSVIINNTENNASTLSFNEPLEIEAHPNAWGLDAGDIDGDGRVDLAIGSTDIGKRITILRNIGSTSTGLSFEKTSISAPEKSRSVKIGDLNNDGKPDISFTGIDNSNFIVLKNNGCIDPEITASNALYFCKNSSLRLEVPRGVGVGYQWLKDEVAIAGKTEYFLDVVETGVYKVTITESTTSCNSTSEAKVAKMVDPVSTDPQFNILSEGITSFCEGDSLILEAEGDFLEYKWNTGETTKSIKVKEGGIYSVEVKAGGGCVVDNEILIDLLLSPEVVITADKTTIKRGESVQIVASGADSYTWDVSGSLSSTIIANPTVNPIVTTTYKVTGQNSSGCTSFASVIIEVEDDNFEVKPHKIFTPNNDGIQDVWEIDNIQDNPDLKVTIFNRAGVKLFEASPYTNNWDGTKNGKKLPHGDYYYIIDDPKSKKKKSGSLMLIR